MISKTNIEILTFGFPKVPGHREVDGEEHGKDNDSREGSGGDEGEVGGEEGAGEDDDQTSEDAAEWSSHPGAAVHCRPEEFDLVAAAVCCIITFRMMR